MKLAELPVTMEGLAPTVPAIVNGMPSRFILDTGAFYSLVTPRAAEKFGLRISSLPPGFFLSGAVGWASAHLGVANTFKLANFDLKSKELLVAGDSLGDADGLIGQEFLRAYDVEYDLANGVVRIFKAKGCDKAMLAYWASPASVSILPIPPTDILAPHILARAAINGQPMRVMFDTGASRSLLKLSSAQRAGAALTDGGASANGALSGIGKRATEESILPFDSFELGDETIKNIKLRVGAATFSEDMLVGADFFLSHHILVSQSQHRLYFTYNGGPVFRLDEAPPGAASADDPVEGWTPIGGAGKADGSDADNLRRRAAAKGARRDFVGAIADLDQAIHLRPEDAELYYERARLRFEARDANGGGGDVAKALSLRPGYEDALILRARIHLAAGEFDKADADFDAAAKAAPDRPDTELAIAEAYAHARQYARAVGRLNAWLARYPTSFSVGAALNARCWTRALWGRELDLALADCNQSLKRGSRLADVLDSRGLVHLRRGEFELAIADFDASLKLQPKLAPSLYGRALAKRKAGDLAGAAADRKAALAIDRQIGGRMDALGITEATVVIAAAN